MHVNIQYTNAKGNGESRLKRSCIECVRNIPTVYVYII